MAPIIPELCRLTLGADKDLGEALTLSVQPVKHTIRIEAVK